MKLRDYLAETNQTMSGFADRIGTKHWNVSRWCAGAWPSPPMLVKIHEATDGRVTPNDWLPSAAPSHQVAA